MADRAYPTRPRRKNRGLRVLVIVIISLVVLLIAADRVGDLVAEHIAAGKLQSSQDLRNEPDVDIGGFPFLTQLASGDYGEVTVTATDVRLGNDTAGVNVSKIQAVLHDLTVSDNFSTYRVAHATAVGTVSYRDLSNALGVDLSYAGSGKIKASKRLEIFGQTITPTITAEPRLVDGGLSFAAFEANGLGALGGQLADVAGQVFGKNLPLNGIPFHVSIKDLAMTPDGLRLDLAGDDLSYSGN